MGRIGISCCGKEKGKEDHHFSFLGRESAFGGYLFFLGVGMISLWLVITILLKNSSYDGGEEYLLNY